MRDLAQAEPSPEFAERIDVALHGLCQPLTVLQCRLALGELAGEPKAMREAIVEALKECERLNQAVEMMRRVLWHRISSNDEKKKG